MQKIFSLHRLENVSNAKKKYFNITGLLNAAKSLHELSPFAIMHDFWELKKL
jgi:hypothetical protein